jgi:UDP-2,3-diacylglucosamine pyrophosphatase LpxH
VARGARASRAVRVYCLSDLHLQDQDEPFLFTAEKEKVFARVCQEALDTGATLVLSGDVFDLTGMTPPAQGLAEFFSKVAPTARRRPTATGVSAQIQSLHGRFPSFFSGLANLAKANRLWMIPGNHDCEIPSDAGRAALAQALGISTASLVLASEFRVGDFLFTEHGNEYDDSNRTDHGCKNRGATITAALYHAIIPALVALDVSPEAAHAVPAVRPEENIVNGLELYLGEDKAKVLLLAFVELLRVNGYFTGLDDAKVWLATHLLPFLVSPENVRKALADDTDLKSVTRSHAQAILAGQEQSSAGPVPKVVVMGHTHELDATSDYVNLGTWVDHVTGLAPADLINVDRSLPVLVIDQERAALYDCLAMTGRVDDCRVLWRRP